MRLLNTLVTFCLISVISSEVNTDRFLSASSVQEDVHESSSPWFLVFTKEESSTIEAEDELKGQLGIYGVNVGYVNCDNPDTKALCKAIAVPSMQLYMSKPAVNPYTKKMYRQSLPYTGKSELRSIEKFISKSFPHQIEIVKAKDEFDMDDNKKPAVVLFAEKETISLFYKSLAFQLQDNYRFFQVTKRSKHLLQWFGVSDFPVLGILSKENGELVLKDYPEAVTNEGRSAIAEWLLQQLDSSARVKPKRTEYPSNVLLPFSLELETFQEGMAYVLAVTDSTPISPENKSLWDKLSKWATGHIGAQQLLCSEDTVAMATELGKLLCSPKEPLSFPFFFVMPHGSSRPNKLQGFTEKMLLEHSFGFDQQEQVRKFASESLPESSVLILDSEVALHRLLGSSQSKSVISVIFLSNKNVVPIYLRNAALSLAKIAQVAFMNNPPPNVLAPVGNPTLPTAICMFETSNEESNAKAMQMLLFDEKAFGSLKFWTLLQFAHMAFQRSGLAPPSSLDNSTATPTVAEMHAIRTEADWDEYCGGEFRGICAVVIGEASQASKMETILDPYMKESASVFNFVSVDGACQSSFAQSFDILPHKFPTIVAYSPLKNRMAEFRGSLTETAVKDFLDGVLGGRIATSSLNARPVILDKCETSFTEISGHDALEDASDVLEEIRREEKAKAAQVQKELEDDRKIKKEEDIEASKEASKEEKSGKKKKNKKSKKAASSEL